MTFGHHDDWMIMYKSRPCRRLVCMEGWKDGRMEGWKDGRMEGWKADFAREFRTVPV